MKNFKRIGQVWSRPTTILAVIALLVAVIVQPGNLGSVDTERRLQVTRSLWRNEPQVTEKDVSEGFGLRGTNGQMYAWYGIGQSLVMLPLDVGVTALLKMASPLGNLDSRSGGMVRRALIAYLMSPLISVLSVLLACTLLQNLGFELRSAMAGSLSLLLGTTFLAYTQVAQENNLVFFLTLCGFSFGSSWINTGKRHFLVLASGAMGFNLLVRLTTIFDLLVVALFILVVLRLQATSWAAIRLPLISFARTSLPIFALCVGIDRLYQWYRFGSWTSSYMSVLGEQWRALHPNLPQGFPFSTPFLEGFAGQLFSAEKSIFIYDPLLILTLPLLICLPKTVPLPARIFTGAALLLLVSQICFHSTYFAWMGGSCWGARFVTVPTQLVAMIGVPWAIHARHKLSRSLKATLYVIFFYSITTQLASTIFSYNLELFQRGKIYQSKLIVAQRAINITAMLSGNFHHWGLDKDIPARESLINFAPFIMGKYFPESITNLVVACWVSMLIFLIVLLWLYVLHLSALDPLTVFFDASYITGQPE
jgi:hypothetical protein